MDKGKTSMIRLNNNLPAYSKRTYELFEIVHTSSKFRSHSSSGTYPQLWKKDKKY